MTKIPKCPHSIINPMKNCQNVIKYIHKKKDYIKNPILQMTD